MLVADAGAGKLFRISGDGSVGEIAAGLVDLIRPVAVAAGIDGSVFVADAGAQQIYGLSPDGQADRFGAGWSDLAALATDAQETSMWRTAACLNFDWFFPSQLNALPARHLRVGD